MKTEVINARYFGANSQRIDAKFFLSPGNRALARVTAARARGVPCINLGGQKGLAKIWQPQRFKRAYAAIHEDFLPYLRPYSVFEYLPLASDKLSIRRNKKIATYKLNRGMILLSCSGRNLGPAVFVDGYLANFIVGDDMIRIEIEDEDLRYYTLAFLQTPTGQHLLRQGKTGSVIDHLSKEHVSDIAVPLLDTTIRLQVSQWMAQAVQMREQARLSLNDIQAIYDGSLPLITRKQSTKEGWTVRSQVVYDRLDAASYDPLVRDIRSALLSVGGVPIREVADVLKPARRYKTNYISEEYGLPILSGTQLLQVYPINLRYISPSALSEPSEYALKAGWLAYQADGRAEETLGLPVMITSDRDGWLASGHVGRLVAKAQINPGWLYLATRSLFAQLQIKSRASGSVVDSTFPRDMESVILPPPSVSFSEDKVTSLWELFAEANRLESKACLLIEDRL